MTIRDLKKGDYFKTSENTKVVYVRDEYDRTTKKYMAIRFDDICKSRLFKSTQNVITDFDF